jgi:hypothetical protein
MQTGRAATGVRAPLAIAAVLSAIAIATLGMLFAGQATGSVLDRWLAPTLELSAAGFSPAYGVSIVQILADPIPAAGLVLLLAACLRFGHSRLALVALAGPVVADAIAILIKHVRRTIHGGKLSYPSTHAA